MTIRFTIPEALPVLNVYSRMHFAKRASIRSRVAKYVRVALNSNKRWPGTPAMARCRIRVVRVCRNAVDPDGLPTCAKAILDVLQPRSKRHPDGQGVILDDSLCCIVDGPTIEQRRCDKGEAAHMLVEIEELP